MGVTWQCQGAITNQSVVNQWIVDHHLALGYLHMNKLSLLSSFLNFSRLIPFLHCPNCARSTNDELLKAIINSHDYLMTATAFADDSLCRLAHLSVDKTEGRGPFLPLRLRP